MRYKKKGAGMPKGARNGMYMNGGKMYATGGAVPGGTGAAPASFWSSAPDAGGGYRRAEFVEVEGMPGLFKSKSGDSYMESTNAGKTATATTPADYKAKKEKERKAQAESNYRNYEGAGFSGNPARRSSLIGNPGQEANPRTGEGVSYGDAFQRYAPEFLREFNKMQDVGLNDVPVVTRDRTQTQTLGGYDPSPRSLGRVERGPRGETMRASQLPEGQRAPALLDFLDMFSEQQKTQGNRYVEGKKKKQQELGQKSKTYKQGGRIR
jgi:hypothetical protein